MEEALSLEKETEGAAELQRREGLLERCWWSFVAVLLVLSLTGLLGKGYLSKTQVSSPDGSVQVEYEWISRYRSELDLKLSIKDQVIRQRELVCEFEQAFMEKLIPRTFTPPPIRVVSDGDRIQYFFLSTEGKPVNISAQLEAVKWGKVTGSLRCGTADAIPLSMLILP